MNKRLEENKALRREVNWQQAIVSRMNFAWNLRQTDPEKFENGIAGAWNSLWPELKEELSKKIGDGERNERYFHELLEQVMEYDFSDEFSENTPEKKKVIRCCEYISSKILEVLEDRGLLYTEDYRPTSGMKKRTLEGGGSDG